MRTLKQIGLILILTIVTVACGNKQASNQNDSTESNSTSAVPAVEEMVLSLQKDDIYEGKPHILVIKGGVSFQNETKPYDVKMKENNYNGTVELGQFQKNPDGSVSISVLPSVNDHNIDDGTIVIEVKDAKGTQKTIDFNVDYLP